jgi:hypothetical protein
MPADGFVQWHENVSCETFSAHSSKKPEGAFLPVFILATPHKDCCTDAKSDFSLDWLKTTQAYWRKSRSFWLI